MKSIQDFANLLEAQQKDQFAKDCPNVFAAQQANPENWQGTIAWKVKITPAAKYTKVDVGTSGKYMIVNATGEIFGIKGYGVIHKGHPYGTLDTIHEWNWAGYVAVKSP